MHYNIHGFIMYIKRLSTWKKATIRKNSVILVHNKNYAIEWRQARWATWSAPQTM